MTDILEEIVARKRRDVEQWKHEVPIAMLEQRMKPLLDVAVPSMRKALAGSATGIIAEFKRRSPSKGWFKKDADASVTPLSYQVNGASALSILTDEPYFGGTDDDIVAARRSGVTLPILYKNFVIDPYQMFQARLSGASAVLLIAAALTVKECRQLLQLAHDLGLEVLLETHSESELVYADLEPDMLGVNNRHLGSFVTDVETSFLLAKQLPANMVKVSESGIKNPQTVLDLRAAGYSGFLMGERFMHETDAGDALQGFIKSVSNTRE